MSKRTTFSTGFERSKLYTYMNLIKYFRRNREFALHDYYDVFEGARQIAEQYLEKPAEDLRILEVGCGQRFAVTLLFHSLGAQASGIDTDFVDPHFSMRGLLSIWKTNGFERFVKTASRHYLFDRQYYDVIRKEFGRPLKVEKLDVRTMNACSLEFDDCEFDYIYSNAVFEHIDDPDKACSEVARVLKSGGIANIGVHLFASLSGGHNLQWSEPEMSPSESVPAWDHLRKNLYPTHVYLNKLRESDFLNIFRKYFSVIDIQSKYEGEKLLTDEILAELPGYTRDDLLKRSIRVIMRK